LVTETSEESVAGRGLFTYLKAVLIEKSSRGRVVRQTLLFDGSSFEAAD
jgi:hypothetical protein